jgi:hypothetical protein
MTINELKQKIKKQEEENIKLYNIFQYRLHEEIMQPVITQWRDGSVKLKALCNELYKIETKEREEGITNKENKKETKTYANQRYITCSTYERADKRMQKEILLFMGVN